MVGQALLAEGANLDWPRFLARMTGLEALLLSHIYLFWHRYPESARAIIPTWVPEALQARMDGDASEKSLHGGSL